MNRTERVTRKLLREEEREVLRHEGECESRRERHTESKHGRGYERHTEGHRKSRRVESSQRVERDERRERRKPEEGRRKDVPESRDGSRNESILKSPPESTLKSTPKSRDEGHHEVHHEGQRKDQPQDSATRATHIEISELGIKIPIPPQVSVLTCKNVDSFVLSDYCWLEKTDGERSIVILNDTNMYLFRKGKLEPLNASESNRDIHTSAHVEDAVESNIDMYEGAHFEDRGITYHADADVGADVEHAHGHAHGDAHGEAHGHAHGDAHGDAHGHAHGDAHGDAHGHAHGHAHGEAHGVTDDYHTHVTTPFITHSHLDTYAAYLYRTQSVIPQHSASPSSNASSYTMLDTEFYNGKYLIFDCPLFNGEDISASPYSLRMERCKSITHSHPDVFTLKQFHEVTNLNDLIAFVNDNYTSPETGNVIDGVILQHKTLPYSNVKPIAYKLKRTVMNTIDFRIIYVPGKSVFYLYLRGTKYDLTRNRKKIPKINNYSQKHVGVNTRNLPETDIYILFASSFYEGLHTFRPRLMWDTSAYFPQETKQIKQLMKSILANPMQYSNKIVELSLNVDGWLPIKVREDKVHSNGYYIGLSNVSIIFNPLVPDRKRYFERSLQTDDRIANAYHAVNRLLRRYITERSIAPIREVISVLDLAGGRGADAVNLYNAGAGNIFVLDSDRDALVQYHDRIIKTSHTRYEPLLSSFRPIPNMPRTILLNCIYGVLGIDNDALTAEIKARFEYPSNGFNVVLMNYAFHYLCYNMKCIDALHSLLSAVLGPKGMFIFTCFDGDAIWNDAVNSTLKLRSFTISLLTKDEITDETFKTHLDEHTVIARMPLPTIDSTGYREEPLVFKAHIDRLNMRLVEKYNLLEECDVPQIKDIEHLDLVSDLLKYVRVYVMMFNS